ncbi:MAG: hypothetical protein ACK2TW_10335 [Anaerolineales bacterium]|jgi:hypothetical protein
MDNKPEFDLENAHKYFSAQCFNKAWDLIDKGERTPEEDEEMVLLTMASMWHWSQRPDQTLQNLSVGCWQAARIYALVGQADNARRYAQLSLDAAREGQLEPFYVGYAYEALARAEKAAGNQDKMDEYLGEARYTAGGVKDDGERKMLMDDLDTIG